VNTFAVYRNSDKVWLASSNMSSYLPSAVRHLAENQLVDMQFLRGRYEPKGQKNGTSPRIGLTLFDRRVIYKIGDEYVSHGNPKYNVLYTIQLFDYL
jgi:hypothetical protein